MTGLPSWAELTAFLVAGSTALWQWVERKDERSALYIAKTEAEKTVASQKITIEEKNNENRALREEHERDAREWKDERERLEDRIEHLESLLYSRGGTA